ncbi:MAG TPA: gamma-glutamylcyclotransferase family protein [Methylocystis sp.]|nr:gamma-glutamylcyclotransferase family protein [Methylocystis sp.]
MPHYFAYGANLDRAAMRQRCPRSRVVCRARLVRHRLIAMSDGLLSVVPDPRANVFGLLWDLALADVRALDSFEGVSRGDYKKCYMPVLREPFGSVRALVYVGWTAEEGAPRPGYFTAILAAARAADLPPAHLAHLETLAKISKRAQQ